MFTPRIFLRTSDGDIVIEHGMITSTLGSEEERTDDAVIDAAYDAVESLLLALTCEGVIRPDNTDATTQALQTTLDAIYNSLG